MPGALPAASLFSRGADSCGIWFVDAEVVPVLRAQRLRVVACGTRIFTKVKDRLAGLGAGDVGVPVRPSQEGLRLLLPHMTKKVLRCGLPDLKLMLRAAAQLCSELERGYTEAINEEEAAAKAAREAAAAAAAAAGEPVATKSADQSGAHRGRLKSLCRHDAFACAAGAATLGDGPAVVALDTSAAALAAATPADALTIAAIKALHDSGHGALEFACVVWCGKTAFNVLVSKLDAENMLTVLGRIEEQCAAQQQ